MSGRVLALGAVLAWLAALPLRAQEALSQDSSTSRIRSLVEQLGARYLDERQQAAEALARIGAPAEPAILEALGHGDFRVRRAACELLARIGGAAAAPRLLPLLEDPEESVREGALDALSRIGPPAHEALRKAGEAGSLTAAAALAGIERRLKRTVEELLSRCITLQPPRRGMPPQHGWGSYKDQFKDIVRLGPAAAPLLVRLFTTPLRDYEFDYAFERELEGEELLEDRKKIMQLQAGSALADLNDRSVVPALQAFLKEMNLDDPARITDPRQDHYETAAYALMKLGDPEPFRRLRDAMLKAGGAEMKEGALRVTPAEDRFQQMRMLSGLAMVFSKAEDPAMAERTYEAILKVAPGGIEQPGIWYNLACAQALQGRRAQAVESLRRAAAAGYHDADWIRRDGDLDAIRGESGYKEVLRQLDAQRGEGGP
jgi:HEAT repeat protein